MMFIVTGPSGAGKTTLIKNLLKRCPELEFSVSHTTRPPRPGEVEGKDYYFIGEEEFSRLVQKKFFVEWAFVHGYRYGTSFAEFKKGQSKDLVLDIDVQGASQIKKKIKGKRQYSAVFVFILPPDKAALERRLRKRGDLSPEALGRRLEKAREELRAYRDFDYVIINRDRRQATRELEAIFLAEHCRRARRQPEIKAVLNSFKRKG